MVTKHTARFCPCGTVDHWPWLCGGFSAIEQHFLGVSCNPCPTIFNSPILRPPEVLEASVKLEASVPSVSSEVLTDDSPSPQEPTSVRPLTKSEPTVQSVSSEIVKDETLSPQEPSSKRSLTTDLTTDTISSNFDTTNLQNFDDICRSWPGVCVWNFFWLAHRIWVYFRASELSERQIYHVQQPSLWHDVNRT